MFRRSQNRQMRRFLVASRREGDEELVERLRAALWCDTSDLGVPYDGIIVLGGDGTVLSTVARYANPPTVYAVNRGRVGFLCSIPDSAIDELIDRLRAGRGLGVVEAKRLCLGQGRHFLNEAVIRPSSPRLGTFRITVDGASLVVRGDAVIVATKTGSSGYNASVGGPLLLCDGIVVNVIAPNRCGFKPIVCGLGSRIHVEVDGDPLVVLDGVRCEEKALEICYDGSSVRFGHLDDYDEFERTRSLFLL